MLTKRSLIKITLFSILLCCITMLCGCDLFKDKKDNSTNQGDTYVVDVKDIYIEGDNVYFEFPKVEKDVILISYITIKDETIDLGKIGVGQSSEEVNLEYTDIYHRINDYNKSDNFTITAYTINEDETKESNHKTVEFDVVMVKPTYLKDSKEIVWETNDNVESYDLRLSGTGTYKIRSYYGNKTGVFDASDAFEEMDTDKVALTITPKFKENIVDRTTYYYRRPISISIGLQTLTNTYFYNNKICWNGEDNEIFNTDLPEVYTLIIKDGEETITETVYGDPTYYYKEFIYYPKTDNFSYTISGGVDHPNIVNSDPLECTPTCIGRVENISYGQDTFFWSIEKFLDINISDYIWKYNIFQDDKEVCETTNTRLDTSNLNNQYGDLNIKISPHVKVTNYYCISYTINAFIGKTPHLELERIDNRSVKVKFSNVDSNAIGYSLETDVLGFYTRIEDVVEGYAYTFTPQEEKAYYLEATPIYEGKTFVLNSTSDTVRVEKFAHVKYEKARIDSYRVWTIDFKDDEYSFVNKVEYHIETPREDKNSSGRLNADEISLQLPVELTDSDNSQEIKIRIRYETDEDTKRAIELSPGFDEYTVKNLPIPTNVSLDEGKLTWEHETDIPHKEDYYITIYKYNSESSSYSHVSTKPIKSKEFDLNSAALSYGNYSVKIQVLANDERLQDGTIVLDSSNTVEKVFHKFNTASVYPTSHSNIIFKLSNSEKSLTNEVSKVKVRIYADDFEETKELQINEEINIRNYLTQLGVNTINADVQMFGVSYCIDSDIKTISISTSEMSGFGVNNQDRKLYWDEVFTNSTYNYSFKMKSDNDDKFCEVLAGEGLAGAELEFGDAVINYLSLESNVDKSFSNLCLTITTNASETDLANQGRESKLILVPEETTFNFNGFSYGVSRKQGSQKELAFNFNNEFKNEPLITAKTTTGTNLGTVLASSGFFSFSSLGEGKHTIVFTNNISNAELDELLTLQLPYYHSLSIYGKPVLQGDFSNFKKGCYYYAKGTIDYALDFDKSTAATVDFKLNSGETIWFDGKQVSTTAGKYTLDLRISNTVVVKASTTAGFISLHGFNKYDTSVEKAFTFDTTMPPTPESIWIKDGVLQVEVSYYSENTTYTIYREKDKSSQTRTFVKNGIYAKDTYDPTDVIGMAYPAFESGEKLIITISGGHNTSPQEADIVVEYTIP